MSVLLKMKPSIKLGLGIVALLLGVLALYLLWNYNTGFLGGLFAGLLIALGLRLIIAYKKQE